MKYRVSDLQRREIVDVSDGTRYGCIGDLEIDSESGAVAALIVCGRPRALGLLGRERDQTFPWSAVKRVGPDLILVEGGGARARHSRE